MKKLITLMLLATCLCQISQAQIKKGSLSLGGGLSGSGNTVTDDAGNLVTQVAGSQISVSLGWAVKDNRVLGFNLDYTGTLSNNFTISPKIKNRSHNFGGGIFFREYYKLSRGFYFFYENNLSYSRGTQRTKNDFGDILHKAKVYTVSMNLATGLSYHLHRRLYVDLSLPELISIRNTVTKPETPIGGNQQGVFSLSSGLNGNILGNLGVGFRLIF